MILKALGSLPVVYLHAAARLRGVSARLCARLPHMLAGYNSSVSVFQVKQT